MKHLPNLLSAYRIAVIPLLAALAWGGHATLFLIALAVSFASDVVDGLVARHAGVTSEIGAKLDSWGDLATFATLPLFAWWLWPDVIIAESRYLALALFAYFTPTAIGLLRFRRLTSYHTWAAKGTSVLMGGAAFLLFLGGPAWPFHLATFALVLEAAEEIAITAVLPRWTRDVPSLWHAVHEHGDARVRTA